MNNTYIILSVGLGVISFGLLLAAVWIIFHNLKKRIFGDQGNQSIAIYPESYWEEKRQYARAGIVWPVSIKTSQGIISAKTKDLSLGGAFIVCQKPLPLKEQFPVTIEVPDKGPLTFTSEVVWSNNHVPDDKIVIRGMGIRFIQNTDEVLESLNTSISAYLKRNRE
ncbi:MAG: PilZ domain-containing protein [Desulfobacteraceae bacterium]|nr:PilZ domain-containing protein [Desulfobacteraceae bacterium]